MASYPKRSRGSLVTEVLCTSGEQETLRAPSAVPPEQQRLVFATSSSVVAPFGGQETLFAELQATQAIIFQDTRALGRLVKPRLLVDSPGEVAPGSLVSLIYDYWQPASVDRKHGPVQHLRIPLDSRYCSTSVFSLSAILTGGPGGPVALPSLEWSGIKTAAAVNQHQQRLDYIRTQQRLYTEGEGKHSPNRHLLARSDAEYTVDIGSEWEPSPLSLTFDTAGELSWLQRIILKLLVIPKTSVDDNGGPIGDTSAEVTVSSSSVGASGLIEMASASAQPVPQGHSGQQQTGRGDQQPADDTLPQAQQTQADAPSSAAAGCVSDTDAECIGVIAAADDQRKPGAHFSPSTAVLANSGGPTGSCRREAVQSSRSAGGGGEPQGSSDSEDGDPAQGRLGSGQGHRAAGSGGGGTGGGVGNGGDKGGPGWDRERAHDPASATPKSGRKQTEKSEPGAVVAAEVNGREPQQHAVTATSSPAVPSSSHSDRDTAASFQEASSRSTTMDTVDASSDAADEPQVGVAESKPTVKLIPNGPACREGGVAHGGANQLEVGKPLALQGKEPCSGGCGSGAGSEGGGAAADSRVCTSGRCGRSSASGAGDEPNLAREFSQPAACPDSAAQQLTVAAEGSGRAAGLSRGRRKSGEAAREPPAVAPGGSVPEEAGHGAGFATVDCAVDASCSEAQSSSPPAAAHSMAPVQLQPPPPAQQQRLYPNGATWPQPHSKGSSQAIEMQQWLQQQPQAHAMSAAAAPHLPHAAHHGVHGHPLQNGKVRNGELLSDPALLAQQLLTGFAPGQSASGSGTPPLAQPAGQPHVYTNGGVDVSLLQQLLLAQSNGPLQMPHPGLPLHNQHMQSTVGMYNMLLQQQAQAQHQQQQIMHMFQPQFQQHVAQQQAQQHHQQQQLFLQGLAHAQGLVHAQGLPQAESQYGLPAAAADPTAFLPAAATPLPAPPAVLPAMEPSALPADASVQQQQTRETAPGNVQPLNPAPIIAPVPAVAQLQASGAHSGDSAGQSAWDTGSASLVRSEPSTAVAAPLLEQPMGPQHRVQSQGNILAGAHGAGGGGNGQAGASRDGSAGRPSAYRGRTSFSGTGGPPGGPGGAGGASSSGTTTSAAQPSVLVQGGGGTYGGRPYGGPVGASRHGGGGGGGGYPRGGRFDGGSADSSRPSSRGPHPQGGGGHMRHPHPADPVPPPEALPLPDPKGSCDLDRFISQIEPVIAIDPSKPPQQALQELRLRDLWSFYFEPSLYGREVFTLGGHRGASNSYFVPYLSAIQIFTRALPTDVGGTNRLYVSEDNQGWPKHMHLKFEYFEQELPFNRLPLYDQIELLSRTMAAGKTGSGGGTTGAPAARAPAAAAPTVIPVSTTASAPTPAPSAAAAPGRREAEALSSSAAADNGAQAAGSGADGSAVAEGDPPGEMNASDPGAGATPNAGGGEGATPPNSDGAQAEGGPSAATQPAQPAQGKSAAAAPAPDADSASATGLLYDMRLLDVHPASWFAVAWYPVYRIPDAPLYARFLTFHSFAPLVESMRNVHDRLAMGQVVPYQLLSLPVVGLNWYNMQGERWMEPLEETRPHTGPSPPPPVAASAHAASMNSPRGPHHHRGGGGRVPGTDVWYQQLLQGYQSTADRLARGVGLKVLGQHGAEEVRLRVPDYEFFRARS